MELYKKYRPTKFKNVVGNEAVIKSISSKIKNNDLPHFILLSGPSGCGKTTIARIIKDNMGCKSADFCEINCANRNGVELAREIESRFRMKSITGGVRIWLLDEAHKMTSACAESMLKPLEDTPDHVYFIFATTDPQKIIKTIRTRATEFKVSPLSYKESESLIEGVCKKEGVEINAEIKENIIEGAGGSARLALVTLDKIKGLDKKDMASQSKEMAEKKSMAYEIFKELMWPTTWAKCAKAIKGCSDDPEGIRRFLLACANNQLLDPTKSKNHDRAFDIIEAFEAPLYDIGLPGVTMACYDIVKG